MRKCSFLFLLLALLIIPVLTVAASGTKESSAPAASAKKSGFVIGLSNSFYGNTWRKQMVQSMEAAAKVAEGRGLVSKFIVDNGDGTANTQIAQMNSLILSNVDLILVNAVSLTGLNGVIAQAHAKGIPVVSFDSIVSSPYAYKMEYDIKSWGTIPAQYLVDRFHGKANVLITRGIVASAPEQEDYNAMMAVFKKHPGMKIVGEVDTEATLAQSQSSVANVLPSLPKVDATIGMSAGYGVVQAFEAAGKPVPVIIGSNRAEFLHWWINEKAKNGYTTISLGSEPSIGQIAFWLGIHILQHDARVPDMITHTLELPLVAITNDTVDQFKDIQPGTVAAQNYTDEWVVDHILNKK